MFWGFLILLAGCLILASKLGLTEVGFWTLFGPLALIAWGLSVLTGGKKKSEPR